MPVSPWRLRHAAGLLARGGVIAHPTEAVYGLACDPLNAGAVLRLLDLKQRPVEKGLILVASDMAQLRPFLAPLSDALLARVSASWPGPVTWLLPAREETPSWLRGTHASLAVRVSAHPLTRELCAAFGGALVSTSANPAGRPPARTALRVRRYFDARLDAILAGALGGQARPTEIRDAATGALIRPA